MALSKKDYIRWFNQGTAFLNAHPTLKQLHYSCSNMLINQCKKKDIFLEYIRNHNSDDDIKYTSAFLFYITGLLCIFTLFLGFSLLFFFLGLFIYTLASAFAKALSFSKPAGTIPESIPLIQPTPKPIESPVISERPNPKKKFFPRFLTWVLWGAWAYLAFANPNEVRHFVEQYNLISYFPDSWQDHLQQIITDEPRLLSYYALYATVAIYFLISLGYSLVSALRKLFPKREIKEL